MYEWEVCKGMYDVASVVFLSNILIHSFSLSSHAAYDSLFLWERGFWLTCNSNSLEQICMTSFDRKTRGKGEIQINFTH